MSDELEPVELPLAEREGDDYEAHAEAHSAREMTSESWTCEHGLEHGVGCRRCEDERE
jgi:hypothetical protein